MLTRLKNTGNVNGILLPGVKTGKWKVRFISLKGGGTFKGTIGVI